MNIAFPALFVFLLALPGIILRYSYREWLWKTPVYPLPIGEMVAKSAFSAAVLNFLWCLLASGFGYRINYGDVLLLLTGGFGLPSAMLADRLEAITRHPLAIAAYFGSFMRPRRGWGSPGVGWCDVSVSTSVSSSCDSTIFGSTH